MGLFPALGLGIAAVAASALLPLAMVLTVFHSGRPAAAVVRMLRRCRLLPAPRVVPGPPVERIAADLRRISGLRRSLPRGASRTRQQAVFRAYDEVLGTACAALEVPHVLATLRPGMDRDLERLRVEEALRDAGLVLDPPSPRHQDLP